jgi:hypothetical protein
MASHAAKALDQETASELRLALGRVRVSELANITGIAASTLTRAAAGLRITTGNRELIRRRMDRVRVAGPGGESTARLRERRP